MIKILFFIPGLSEGGAEKVLRNLVNNMDQSKFDITVQTINEYDPKKYLNEGIHYKSIFHCRTKIGRKLMNYWYRFCTEFKLTYPLYIKDDYDIEVAYLECGATKVMAASTNKKAVKLAWVHCDLKKKGLTAENSGKYYSKFDKVVCVSQDVKKSFDELFGNCAESVVLYNVIDEDEIFQKAFKTVEWNCEPEQKRLLAVGRLTEQKNFAYLVDECGKLRDDGCQFHLNILGEGPERENLEKRIKKLNLENCVELKGFTSNPYSWMNTTDIVVCSSKYEGISTVIQEALILGKAVITTPCTGMKELLGNSEYGMIAKKTENGLYDCIKEMINDRGVKKYYTQMAQKRGKDFTKKEILFQVESFFYHQLSKKAKIENKF